ncbi:MAG: ribonuclease P protein component [Nitrosomonadales bacterium]|nr:ribonuclease P protein component [Nitrosomonadales bacterium]
MQNSQFSIRAKLSAAQRLLRKDGFNHVIKSENIAGSCYKVFFTRNKGKSARLGIIAGKKTIPSATNRNRAKREIRETFRQHNIRFCKLDLVVLVRPAYIQGLNKRDENLIKLFGLVENRCEKS